MTRIKKLRILRTREKKPQIVMTREKKPQIVMTRKKKLRILRSLIKKNPGRRTVLSIWGKLRRRMSLLPVLQKKML